MIGRCLDDGVSGEITEYVISRSQQSLEGAMGWTVPDSNVTAIRRSLSSRCSRQGAGRVSVSMIFTAVVGAIDMFEIPLDSTIRDGKRYRLAR